MRCATGLAFAITILVTAFGCKNQSTPLTNPFLTPDRVPPPSTRVLTPGTAQPYYPGDPLPGTAQATVPIGGFPAATAMPPAGTFAPSTLPPANAYPGGFPSGPVTPTAPVSPPGGWGGYGPRAENLSTGAALTAGDAVQIPNDEQQMRFASAPTPSGAFTPNAGSLPPIQRAAYDEAPASGPPGLQQLQIREVTPAEYILPNASGAMASPTLAPSRDGFRPQGSDPRPVAVTDSPITKGFRPPSTTGGGPTDASAKFGVGPNQEWLRGQLEYWPTTGEWSIKYMGDGPVDQIGGRILIDNPQVLGHLPPGEFVVVEGQLFGRQIDDATYRPAYRVAGVQRQNK